MFDWVDTKVANTFLVLSIEAAPGDANIMLGPSSTRREEDIQLF